MIHEITNKTDDITHIEVDQILDNGSHIEVHVWYGTLDTDGVFSRHPLIRNSPSMSVTITDVEAFETSSSTSDTAPDVKADPRNSFEQDVVDYIDANDLWHTSQTYP